MTDGLTAAVSGLNAAAQQVHAAANNIVNAHTEGYTPVEVSTASVVTGTGRGTSVAGGVLVQVQEQAGGVDLAREAVSLIQAEAAYKANASVINTVEELGRELLDVTG